MTRDLHQGWVDGQSSASIHSIVVVVIPTHKLKTFMLLLLGVSMNAVVVVVVGNECKVCIFVPGIVVVVGVVGFLPGNVTAGCPACLPAHYPN